MYMLLLPGRRRPGERGLPGGPLLLHHCGGHQEIPGVRGNQGSKTDPHSRGHRPGHQLGQ